MSAATGAAASEARSVRRAMVMVAVLSDVPARVYTRSARPTNRSFFCGVKPRRLAAERLPDHRLDVGRRARPRAGKLTLRHDLDRARNIGLAQPETLEPGREPARDVDAVQRLR